jgi:hypothetical protein
MMSDASRIAEHGPKRKWEAKMSRGGKKKKKLFVM